jgi:hypothetical protein
MPNRILTQEDANIRLQAQGPDTITPAQWAEAMREAPGVPYRPMCDHCFHRLPSTQICCWCGQHRAPQHGPYAPEGDR